MGIGEIGLIRRAQLLALTGPWYASSMCTTCELLELDFDSKDILWICCGCGDGPMLLRICESCVCCGHALCSL